MNEALVGQPWKQFMIAFAVLAFVASIGLFDEFTAPHVNMWDEATYALNAYDQAYNGFSLTLTSEGEPDYYNTKPPLAIWFEAFFIRLFGFNTLGIRIHSILFAFLTALLTWFTCLKVSNRNPAAILSGVILLLSQGYIHTHVARTGDLDSTLVFFETIYVAVTLLFAMEKISWMWFSLLFILGSLGAFLSKGIAGYFMMPSVIMIMLLLRSDQLKSLLFYVPIVISLILSSLYYLLKWISDAEFWNIVYRTEITRYWDDGVIHWIQKPFSFYFDWIGTEGFYPFSYLLLLGILPLILLKQLRSMLQALYLIPLVFLLIISVPQAKMHWYDAAVYPWLAILAAVCLDLSFETLKAMIPKHRTSLLVMLGIISMLMLYTAYIGVQKANRFQSETITDLEAEGHAISLLIKSNTAPRTIRIYKPTDNPEFNDQLKVSILAAEESDSIQFSLIQDKFPAHKDLPLLISKANLNDTLLQLLNPMKIDTVGNCLLVK